MLHYFLMLTYYPSVAIGWLLGITISACYLGFGVASLHTNAGWWLSFYADIAGFSSCSTGSCGGTTSARMSLPGHQDFPAWWSPR